MNRLVKKIFASTSNIFKYKRLIRRAEFVDVEATDPNLVQNITNVMAAGGKIEILYTDGQWRTILPYGWNSSKDGNVLIMCYKDTGDVRSYRLDRIQMVRMDEANLSEDSMMGEQEQFDNSQGFDSEFDIPPDLGVETTQNEPELPFDEALDVLNTEIPVEEIPAIEENAEEDPEKNKQVANRLRKRMVLS